MAKFESIPTTAILPNGTMLRMQHLPELVHMDDSALSVMTDFTVTPPHIIKPDETMDHAIKEMEVNGVHLLLVINDDGYFQGIISSEDIWGEKPIKMIQERRIHRDQIYVKNIMVPFTNITAFDFAVIQSARVGHIVKTLSEQKQHYALAVCPCPDRPTMQTIRGIFTASQISKQLHADISDVFGF